jgi:hypothetical protein
MISFSSNEKIYITNGPNIMSNNTNIIIYKIDVCYLNDHFKIIYGTIKDIQDNVDIDKKIRTSKK